MIAPAHAHRARAPVPVPEIMHFARELFARQGTPVQASPSPADGSAVSPSTPSATSVGTPTQVDADAGTGAAGNGTQAGGDDGSEPAVPINLPPCVGNW